MLVKINEVNKKIDPWKTNNNGYQERKCRVAGHTITYKMEKPE